MLSVVFLRKKEVMEKTLHKLQESVLLLVWVIMSTGLPTASKGYDEGIISFRKHKLGLEMWLEIRKYQRGLDIPDQTTMKKFSKKH